MNRKKNGRKKYVKLAGKLQVLRESSPRTDIDSFIPIYYIYSFMV